MKTEKNDNYLIAHTIIEDDSGKTWAVYWCGEEILSKKEITWEDVPGTTIESCGNYKDHSLHSAKEWAKLILEQGISDQAFERHTV